MSRGVSGVFGSAINLFRLMGEDITGSSESSESRLMTGELSAFRFSLQRGRGVSIGSIATIGEGARRWDFFLSLELVALEELMALVVS